MKATPFFKNGLPPSYSLLLTGFIQVLEILQSPGILFWHFPGLSSPGKLMQVLESSGNL